LYIHAGTQLIAQSDGTTTLYHLHDGLGSTRQLVDSTGAPVLSQTFDPYGSLYLSAGSAESSFGWAGEARDANGLTYLRARYYNPTMGRFLNLDPSRQEQNPFVYSNANPVMFTDPSGNTTECSWHEDCTFEEQPPVQIGGEGSIPVWHDTEGNPHTLRFEPNVFFKPLRYDPGAPYPFNQEAPASQFDIEGYEGYMNLCGPFAVGAIVQNLLGDKFAPTIAEILNATIYGQQPDDNVGVTYDCYVNQGCPVEYNPDGTVKKKVSGTSLDQLADLAEYLGVQAELDASLKGMNQVDYFDSIRTRLNGSVRTWPIVLVEIKNDGHPNYKLTDEDDIEHWIVITGTSVRWADGEDWQWVRIFNPIVNGQQYYPVGELFGSIDKARNSVNEHRVLWLTK
jgi:RHS repeat-associated protein